MAQGRPTEVNLKQKIAVKIMLIRFWGQMIFFGGMLLALVATSYMLALLCFAIV